MERPRHLNSLGYVIAGSATERASSQAMIAWGEKPNGVLVHINDAAAGLADGLKCACGAPLVARKGEIRVHHFAHKAGAVKACEQAQLKALGQFARKTFLQAGELILPPIGGRRLTVTVDDIRNEIFGQCAGVWITTVKGEKRSEIAVLLVVRRGRQRPSKAHFETLEKSAMWVDLTAYRNRADHEIVHAMTAAHDRDWIFNARHPDRRVRSASNEATPENPQSLPPRRAIASPPKVKPSITEDEWQRLHYTELRRRVFGWSDKEWRGRRR